MAVTPTEASGALNVEVVDDHQHSGEVSASPFAPFRHRAFFRLEMGVQVADTSGRPVLRGVCNDTGPYLGVLIAAAVTDNREDGQGFGARSAWLYVTLLSIGYMISRGPAKAGSRERNDA